MTQLHDHPVAARPDVPRPRRLLRHLARPRDAFSNIGPNRYASIMGTGIVAIAAASLPVDVPGLHAFGAAVWLLASFLLVALTAAWAVHWTRHTDRARAHAHDPVTSQFFGAVSGHLLALVG